MTQSELPVGEVVVGSRMRKSVGSVLPLAKSIETVGLLHPLVVNSRRELIAGGRRLEAVKKLGWVTVPVRVVETLDDAVAALKAELYENTDREPLTPTEVVEAGRRIEELEKPEAARRQAASQAKKGVKVGVQGGGNLPPPENKGKTRDKVGEALGVSGSTYDRAKQVVAAAEAEPEKYGDLPARMDESSVNAAHKELKARQSPVETDDGHSDPAAGHVGEFETPPIPGFDIPAPHGRNPYSRNARDPDPPGPFDDFLAKITATTAAVSRAMNADTDDAKRLRAYLIGAQDRLVYNPDKRVDGKQVGWAFNGLKAVRHLVKMANATGRRVPPADKIKAAYQQAKSTDPVEGD
jgi:hypothetical protein